MKLSCLPVSFFRDIISGSMTLAEWASCAKELGMDGIDLSVLLIKDRTPVTIARALHEISSQGMNVIMVTTYSDFTHPDETQREREYAYALADIALASSLGAKYLRITAGQDYQWDDEEEALLTVRDYFLRLKPFADQMNIGLLFENHSKPGAWVRPDFIFNTHRFLRLAQLLEGTGIRINFDTANTSACGDDTVETFRKVLPMVETLHVNDIRAIGCTEFVVCGKGVAPIRRIFHEARKAGFDGWVCIEEAGFMGLEGFRQAVDFTRKAWTDAL